VSGGEKEERGARGRAKKNGREGLTAREKPGLRGMLGFSWEREAGSRLKESSTGPERRRWVELLGGKKDLLESGNALHA